MRERQRAQKYESDIHRIQRKSDKLRDGPKQYLSDTFMPVAMRRPVPRARHLCPRQDQQDDELLISLSASKRCTCAWSSDSVSDHYSKVFYAEQANDGQHGSVEIIAANLCKDEPARLDVSTRESITGNTDCFEHATHRGNKSAPRHGGRPF